MATVIPSTGARYFSKIFGDNHGAPAFQYIFDSGVVWQNLNGQLITGGARPVVPSDLASTSNISVSGLSLTVGAVAITGTPDIRVANTNAIAVSGQIQGGNLLPVYVTGLIDARITGISTIAGTVTVNGGIAVTGNPGYVLTGLNSALTFPISASNGIIAIQTGVTPVSITNTLPINVTGIILTQVTGNITSTSSATAITGNPGFVVTGFNTGVTVNVNIVGGSSSSSSVAITGAPVVTITGVLPVSATVTIGAVAITGQNSGSALGNLDVTRTYLPVSGVGTFATTVAGTVTTNANITNAIVPVSGFFTPIWTGAPNVTASVTIGNLAITGFNSTIAPLAISGNVTTTATIGNIAITGAPVVTITGVLATSTSVTVGNVAVTGGNLGVIITGLNAALTFPVSNSTEQALLNMTNQLLSGVSGSLTTNLTAPAYVTGAVSGTNLGSLDLSRTYLPISGIAGWAPVVTITGVVATSASVTVGNIAITGFNSTIAPLAISGNVTTTATIGNVAITGFNSTIAPLAISGNVTTTATIGNVAITGFNATIAPLAVSGTFTATIGNVAVTGLGNLDVTRSYLPVSGILGVGVIGIDTGIRAVSVTNTAPIAISGVVLTIVTGTVSSTISNPIGVSGVAIDRALPTIGGFATQFVPMGGRMMNPSGAGSVTGYNSTGDMAMFNIAPNGGLYTNQGVLDPTQDIVAVIQSGSAVSPSSTVSGISTTLWGTPLPANPARIAWGFQNLSTGVMFVRMGTLVNSGNAHQVLKGGTNAMDGLGASWLDSPCVWRGPISVTGYFNVSPAYTCWEL